MKYGLFSYWYDRSVKLVFLVWTDLIFFWLRNWFKCSTCNFQWHFQECFQKRWAGQGNNADRTPISPGFNSRPYCFSNRHSIHWPHWFVDCSYCSFLFIYFLISESFCIVFVTFSTFVQVVESYVKDDAMHLRWRFWKSLTY